MRIDTDRHALLRSRSLPSIWAFLIFVMGIDHPAGGEDGLRGVLTGIDDANPLHEDISNTQRIKVIKNVPLDSVLSAPGHADLRNPGAVMDIAEVISQTEGQGVEQWVRSPIVINVTTVTQDGVVRVKNVELFDGNHRFAGGLISQKWHRIGDIPPEFVEVRVNGHLPHGGGVPHRWIPLDVAQRSTIPWFDVSSNPNARGPTAQIPGSISSSDRRFDPQDRGVPMTTVVARTESRLGGSLAAKRCRRGPGYGALGTQAADLLTVGAVALGAPEEVVAPMEGASMLAGIGYELYQNQGLGPAGIPLMTAASMTGGYMVAKAPAWFAAAGPPGLAAYGTFMVMAGITWAVSPDYSGETVQERKDSIRANNALIDAYCSSWWCKPAKAVFSWFNPSTR